MNRSDKFQDRRKEGRFKVPSDLFVIVKRPCFKLGQITDMSMGGMAFCYLDIRLENPDSVDIFLADNCFYMDGIPVDMVWNRNIVMADHFSSKALSRCGISFKELTEDQKNKLACFIPGHDAGFILDRRFCQR